MFFLVTQQRSPLMVHWAKVTEKLFLMPLRSRRQLIAAWMPRSNCPSPPPIPMVRTAIRKRLISTWKSPLPLWPSEPTPTVMGMDKTTSRWMAITPMLLQVRRMPGLRLGATTRVARTQVAASRDCSQLGRMQIRMSSPMPFWRHRFRLTRQVIQWLALNSVIQQMVVLPGRRRAMSVNQSGYLQPTSIRCRLSFRLMFQALWQLECRRGRLTMMTIATSRHSRSILRMKAQTASM